MRTISKIIISLTVVGGIFLIVFAIKKNFNTNSQDNSSAESSSLPETPKKKLPSDNTPPSKTDKIEKGLPPIKPISSEGKDKSEGKDIEFISIKTDNNTFKYHFQQGETKISYVSFIQALKNRNQKIFSSFQGALKDANAKLSAYFWECLPVSKQTLNKDFEFVVKKSKALNDMKQNYSSFSEYINKDSEVESIIHSHSFSSPGKDGILVIPGLRAGLDYKNLSQFTENASIEQQQIFWKEVAEKLSDELEKQPTEPRWLSTHGLGRGTAYLHVRIYDNPKYYHTEEYKIFQG